MVKGVTAGYRRSSRSRAIGFKAILKGKQIDLALGYSHPDRRWTFPEGIKVLVTEGTKLKIEGCDKQLVGAVTAEIPQLLSARALQGQGRAPRGRARLAARKARPSHLIRTPMNTILKAGLLQKRRWRIRKKVTRHRRAVRA